jgi:hypothetical protein
MQGRKRGIAQTPDDYLDVQFFVPIGASSPRADNPLDIIYLQRLSRWGTESVLKAVQTWPNTKETGNPCIGSLG